MEKRKKTSHVVHSADFHANYLMILRNKSYFKLEPVINLKKRSKKKTNDLTNFNLTVQINDFYQTGRIANMESPMESNC